MIEFDVEECTVLDVVAPLLTVQQLKAIDKIPEGNLIVCINYSTIFIRERIRRSCAMRTVLQKY